MSIQFDDDDFIAVPSIKRSLDSEETKDVGPQKPILKKPNLGSKNLMIAIIVSFLLGLTAGFFIGTNNPFKEELSEQALQMKEHAKYCEAHKNQIEPDSLQASVCETAIFYDKHGYPPLREPSPKRKSLVNDDNLPSLK